MNWGLSSGRTLSLAVTALSFFFIVGAAMAGSTVQSHLRGSWMYPPGVVAKLENRGYPSPACSGRGSYRWTNRSRPDDHQTWQYKHFECYSGVNPPTIKWLCVHSLQHRRIFISRVMIGDAYRRCHF
jgi:hypothetical protein